MGFSERRERVLSLLSVRGSLEIQQICELVGCSEATARRDVTRMEREGVVERYWGGVRRRELTDLTSRGLDLQNLRPNISHLIIGRAAAATIRPGESVFIGSGTTTLAMIPFMEQEGLHVVTNGFPQLVALSRKGIDAFLLCGQLKEYSRSLVGEQTVEQLSHYRFDRCFFGVNGVSPNDELLSADAREDEIKRLCIQRSRAAYALASADKFNKTAPYSISIADSFHAVVVTDRRPSKSSAWYEKDGACFSNLLELALGERILSE